MAKPKIHWKRRFPCRGVKAETAYAEVVRIKKGRGGRVKPEDIVAEARKRANPLHPIFDWDDKRAAHLHRLQQARNLLGAIEIEVVVEKGKPAREVRAFLCVASEREDDNGMEYMDSFEALGDVEIAQGIIEEAKEELRGWRERWKAYNELAGLLQRVEAAAGI